MKLAAISIFFLLAACKTAPSLNKAGLEKYPQCYHHNVKIANKCIEKNDAGEKVTAGELENTAYPGEYK
jgi:hypothetical protein